MATIRKRRKTWVLDYYLDGKRIQKAIGPYKGYADLVLADIKLKIARRRTGLFATDKKLSEYIPEFLSYMRVHSKPLTTKRYQQVIDHFSRFLDTLEDPPGTLSQVNPPLIEQYKLRRLNSVQSQTVNIEITLLHHFFRHAVEMKYIASNPTQNIKKIKKPVTKAPPFLTKKEIARLLEQCRPSLSSIVKFLLNTGMRWGELQNLEWDDIDWEKKEIHIRIKEHWSPKGDERKIPMNDIVQRILKSSRRREKWVFTTKTGSQVTQQHTWDRLKIACQRAKLRNAGPHVLRHTFASHLVMAGVDLATVSKLLGHKDISTTMIYSHLSPDHLRRAVERLQLVAQKNEKGG